MLSAGLLLPEKRVRLRECHVVSRPTASRHFREFWGDLQHEVVELLLCVLPSKKHRRCTLKLTPGLNALLAIDELCGEGAHLGLCDKLDQLIEVVCNGLKAETFPALPLQDKE